MRALIWAAQLANVEGRPDQAAAQAREAVELATDVGDPWLVALCEALEERRVRAGALLLMPGFGGGLSYCAHLVRWGSRTTPLTTSTAELPPNTRPALEIVRECLARKRRPAPAAAAAPFG